MAGNNQFDWFGFLICNSAVVLEMLIEDVFKRDSHLKLPFYSNPGMDRRLIPSIIRAGKYRDDFEFYDLTAVSFSERYTACSLLLPVEKQKIQKYSLRQSLKRYQSQELQSFGFTLHGVKPVWAHTCWKVN